MRLAIEVAECRAALHLHEPRLGIDQHAAHGGEVDDDAVVAQRPAGDVVAAAPHRHQKVVPGGEFHRVHDVGRTEAAHDQTGVPVDGRIPDPAGIVVIGIGGPDQASSQARWRTHR